jgi:succinyl-diaminopimelate desuccinylase
LADKKRADSTALLRRCDHPDLQRAERQILGSLASAVELLEELVQIHSVNPPGEQYLECALLLAERLRDLGFEPRIVQVPAHELQHLGLPPDTPRPSVLAALGPDDVEAPTFHFHGHYDVVPADTDELFRLRVEGDRARGRGTADMKGGLVALLLAMSALRPYREKLHGRVLLSIVPDEETGGEAGTGYLFRSGTLAGNGLGMLMPEPAGRVAWHGNRGAISQLLTLHGEMAHVSLQHQGRNAFEGMLELGALLQQLKIEVEARSFGEDDLGLEGPPSILLLGGICRGGTNFNVVSEAVSFSIDRRFHPGESEKDVERELEAVYRKFRRTGWALTVQNLQSGSASLTPSRTPLAEAMAGVVGSVTGTALEFTLCPGILESRFFLAHNTPALAYGPGLLEVSHTHDEYVSLARILEVACIYARMAWVMLGPQTP